MVVDSVWIFIAIFVFLAGFHIGGLSSDNYWASHEKDLSCIYHKGTFYRVLTESRIIDLESTERAFQNRLDDSSDQTKG